MRSLEQVNIRTNVRTYVCTYVRTYVLTYIRTGQTLYPLHNFVVRGDNYTLLLFEHTITQRQATPQRKTKATEINKQSYGVNTCLGTTCHKSVWQVVPRQVFTPYFHLLISTAFVVVSHAGCLRVTGVNTKSQKLLLCRYGCKDRDVCPFTFSPLWSFSPHYLSTECHHGQNLKDHYIKSCYFPMSEIGHVLVINRLYSHHSM